MDAVEDLGVEASVLFQRLKRIEELRVALGAVVPGDREANELSRGGLGLLPALEVRIEHTSTTSTLPGATLVGTEGLRRR